MQLITFQQWKKSPSFGDEFVSLSVTSIPFEAYGVPPQLVCLENGKYINPDASAYENTMMDLRRELEPAVSAFTCVYYAPCTHDLPTAIGEEERSPYLQRRHHSRQRRSEVLRARTQPLGLRVPR